MKANRKYVEDEEAVSVLVGTILMVAITVAVSTTLYIYLGGVGSAKTVNREIASVAGKATQDQIKLILASGGTNYDNGYIIANDLKIFVDGIKVSQYDTIIWKKGEQLLFGDTDSASWEEGETCTEGNYKVTVTIKDTVVFDGTIKVG